MAESAGIVVDMLLKESSLRLFRKAINVMKDVAVFITFRVFAPTTLRLSVVDHFATGGMYVDVPVATTSDVWINLASEDLFELSKALTTFRHDVAIVVEQNNFALFLNANTHKSILPNTTFPNFAPSYNHFYSVNENAFHVIKFVSQDLLTMLTCLSLGSAVIHVKLSGSGQLELCNVHELGQTSIRKQLRGQMFDVDATEFLILDQMYVNKFTKLLVNPLVNSSSTTCFLLFPKICTQPLVVKFLLANDTYQYYLIFPFIHKLEHQIQGPQASIKMKT